MVAAGILAGVAALAVMLRHEWRKSVARWSSGGCDGAAPYVLICDSCDGSLAQHSSSCPRVTGRESLPFHDVRRIK